MEAKKKKRVGVSKTIRTRILARDNGMCQKCGRKTHLNIHHIQAVQDGGNDEDNNLITLCVPCHREWGLAEMVLNVSFEEWLPLPPYSVLVSTFLIQQKEGTLMYLHDWSYLVMDIHKTMRIVRASGMMDAEPEPPLDARETA